MIKKIKIKGYRKHKSFEFEPNPRFNLIVGSNESGKSTFLEAVVLALTGRVNGRRASEELNPFWFNSDLVREFVENRQARGNAAFPEISIEIFLENLPELQNLCGAINSDVPTNACPGVAVSIKPNKDYEEELEKWAANPTEIIPVEYYEVEWRSFADKVLSTRPRQLATAVIDSRTVRSTAGIDYHLRQILSDYLESSERAEISLTYRNIKASMSDESLKGVNARIGELNAALHHQPISLAMDQSSRASWEESISPHVSDIPFSMSGQGQQAAIKISLAMNRSSEYARFVMIEEPENHLSHTSLTTLISRIESLARDNQQVFITTHSSFVLNRLGLNSIMLVGDEGAKKIPELNPGTVGYFKKLPGYDTLRMALAEKVVLVEGPSDEIIFERVFKDIFGIRPMEAGVDVISMRGLSLQRCLELCAALNKPVAAMRDNDGDNPESLREIVCEWLEPERRELFIGAVENGQTLEPQLISHNDEIQLRRILGIQDRADLSTWMTREKTEGALRIAESEESIIAPDYMERAARFIYAE
ncbi:putative ATP-dependent endonuclease of OLD family [Onishia taeanensis]|uniref:Putative ATP-dependent endonuclease of OLD family n=1 Tax=Onishia taeanensis TaxID=284577 RepID=A0A328XE08_9GAMM|nr:AAA family ATPase [Halomonas taeanensis]RAR57015.1 putative ATP-dependent endonuclease of OLD family [Halomonas taeanensis]